MKAIWDFIWYCITSMFAGFSALFGHIPENFSWKEALAGGLTFLVIVAILALLGCSVGLITFRKKGK